MLLSTPKDPGPICYVCDQPSGRYGQQVRDPYAIIKCGECGLEYTFPIPTEVTLREFYAQYQDVRADHRVVELNARGHLSMLEQYGWTPQSRMLDFGAGDCIFVQVAGANCYGVEWRSDNHARVRQTLAEFDGESWDFITLWGVLEHVTNPKLLLADLVSSLWHEGILAVTTVDAEGQIPYYYKPPEHLTYWTRASFDVLAQSCGLEIIEYQPYFMTQLGHIYASRLLSRTPIEYQEQFSHHLPEMVTIPTNEIRVVMKKVVNDRGGAQSRGLMK
jgi:hypothetical protein